MSAVIERLNRTIVPGLKRRTAPVASVRAETIPFFGIVLPHVVYDGAGTDIDLGGRTMRLQTRGTAHTRGDQVPFLPAERILFAGDLIEQGMFPIFPWFLPDDTDVDGLRW